MSQLVGIASGVQAPSGHHMALSTTWTFCPIPHCPHPPISLIPCFSHTLFPIAMPLPLCQKTPKRKVLVLGWPVEMKAADCARGLGTTWQPGCCWFNLTLAIPSCRIRLSWDTKSRAQVNSNNLGDTSSLTSHPRPSCPTFWEPSISQPHSHGCCLKGLFGSSALHTLSLAASQGWPQGPGYAINQYNQTTRPAWVEIHTKLKDRPPNPNPQASWR